MPQRADGERVPAPDPRAVGVVQVQPQLTSAGERRKKEDAPPVVGPVQEKGQTCLSSRAASYTADKANRNPSGSYTRDANRGNSDTESAGP